MNFQNTGNRCGHDPESPNLLAFGPKRYTRTKEGATNEVGVFTWHELNTIHQGLQDSFFRRTTIPTAYHYDRINQDGTPRAIRSDGLESAYSLLMSILAHCDFKSWRVGYESPSGEFMSRPLSYLGWCAGMPHKKLAEDVQALPTRTNAEIFKLASYKSFASKRTERAIELLRKMGAITTHKQSIKYEKFDVDGNVVSTKYVAKPAVKRVNKDFLLQIPGVTKKLIDRLIKFSMKQREKFLEAVNDEFSRRRAAAQVTETRKRAHYPKYHEDIKETTKSDAAIRLEIVIANPEATMPQIAALVKGAIDEKDSKKPKPPD